MAIPASMSAALAAVVAVGGVAGELAGGGELGGHVGQVVADGLVLPDRLAEALPLLRVAPAHPPARPSPPRARARPPECGRSQGLSSSARSPCPVRRRGSPTPARGSRRTSARTTRRPCSRAWADPATPSARGPCSTQHHRDALVLRAWRSGSVLHSSAISPDRRALVIHVLAPLITSSSPSAQRGGRHVLQIRAAAGFGQRHGRAHLAGRHRGQVRALLLLGAEQRRAAWRRRCARPSRRPGSSSRGPAPG